MRGGVACDRVEGRPYTEPVPILGREHHTPGWQNRRRHMLDDRAAQNACHRNRVGEPVLEPFGLGNNAREITVVDPRRGPVCPVDQHTPIPNVGGRVDVVRRRRIPHALVAVDRRVTAGRIGSKHDRAFAGNRRGLLATVAPPGLIAHLVVEIAFHLRHGDLAVAVAVALAICRPVERFEQMRREQTVPGPFVPARDLVCRGPRSRR